jgi:hypothetical protein
MSLIHYLSIGHFEAVDMPQTTLVERVVAHFEPGGLARLGAPAAPSPLTDHELDRLERVLKEQWELSIDLRAHLRDGVLTVPYTSEGIWRIAWPIAAVAREELGLTVAERGQPYSDAEIRAKAETTIAAAVRAGNASGCIARLEQEHDAWTMRWPDAEFQRFAVAGLDDRAALVRTVCELDNPGDLFLLLRETQ